MGLVALGLDFCGGVPVHVHKAGGVVELAEVLDLGGLDAVVDDPPQGVPEHAALLHFLVEGLHLFPLTHAPHSLRPHPPLLVRVGVPLGVGSPRNRVGGLGLFVRGILVPIIGV